MLIIDYSGHANCSLLPLAEASDQSESSNEVTWPVLTNQRAASWDMSTVVSNQECDAINYTITNLYIHKASPWLASSLPHTLCNVNSPEHHVRPSIVIWLDSYSIDGNILYCAGILCRYYDDSDAVPETIDKLISSLSLIFMLPLTPKEKFGFSL